MSRPWTLVRLPTYILNDYIGEFLFSQYTDEPFPEERRFVVPPKIMQEDSARPKLLLVNWTDDDEQSGGISIWGSDTDEEAQAIRDLYEACKDYEPDFGDEEDEVHDEDETGDGDDSLGGSDPMLDDEY